MTAPVTGQERTEPIAVGTVVTGEWIITLNADRGQTLSALRQFIYPSFAALTEEDMHELSSGAASPS